MLSRHYSGFASPQRTPGQGTRRGTQLGTAFRLKLVDGVCSVGRFLEGMASPLESTCPSSVALSLFRWSSSCCEAPVAHSVFLVGPRHSGFSPRHFCRVYVPLTFCVTPRPCYQSGKPSDLRRPAPPSPSAPTSAHICSWSLVPRVRVPAPCHPGSGG